MHSNTNVDIKSDHWRLKNPITYNGITFTAGSTLLHAAVQANKPDVIKFLLGRRVSLLCKDADGRTAVDMAVELKDHAPDALNALTSYDTIIIRVLHEFFDHDLDNDVCVCVERLLEHGAKTCPPKDRQKPNKLNRWVNDVSALHVAVSLSTQGSNIVKMLLKHGACVQYARQRVFYHRRLPVSIDNYETALHIALAHHNTDSVRELLAAGADVNYSTTDGDTPVHVICRSFDTCGLSCTCTSRCNIVHIESHCANIWQLVHAGVTQITPSILTHTNLLLTWLDTSPTPNEVIVQFCFILLALGDKLGCLYIHEYPHKAKLVEFTLLSMGLKAVQVVLEAGFK